MPQSVHAHYPWLLPIILGGSALAVLLVGLYVKVPWAIWSGLVVVGVALVWGAVAYLTLETPKQATAQAQAATSLNTTWVKDLKAEGPLTAVGDSGRRRHRVRSAARCSPAWSWSPTAPATPA